MHPLYNNPEPSQVLAFNQLENVSQAGFQMAKSRMKSQMSLSAISEFMP